jgi:hypothetical protein
MSTLGAIEDAGLKDDLEVLFAEFFKKDDAKAKAIELKDDAKAAAQKAKAKA